MTVYVYCGQLSRGLTFWKEEADETLGTPRGCAFSVGPVPDGSGPGDDRDDSRNRDRSERRSAGGGDEVFSALNRPHFAPPVLRRSDPAFGKITHTRSSTNFGSTATSF